MEFLKKAVWTVALATWMLSSGCAAFAQGNGGAQPAPQRQAQPAPMPLEKLGDSTPPKDPFPPTNPKYFTATSPTVDTVNSFLRALWGYDPNRIWRVAAIQKTDAAGVSKVVVFVAERAPNAKVQTTEFFTLPDGKHAIAGGVVPFGATPFADLRKTLQDQADGPYRGSSNKDLMLVEFSDLQCPHCKEAQETMDRLVKDFPKARVVYENFPLTEIHPAAFEAAAYGVCVAKKSNDAFFTYAQAVFDTQGALDPAEKDNTLKAAVTKAGMDPATVAVCAGSQATKDEVNKQMKLGESIGIDQTPLLAVNGHVLPIGGVPYETLKQIIMFQAQLDGVSTGATASTTVPTPALQQRSGLPAAPKEQFKP